MGMRITYCALYDLLGYHRLNDVGTVKTVHAIEPKHSFLSAQWLTSLLSVKPRVVSTHVILNKKDHNSHNVYNRG